MNDETPTRYPRILLLPLAYGGVQLLVNRICPVLGQRPSADIGVYFCSFALMISALGTVLYVSRCAGYGRGFWGLELDEYRWAYIGAVAAVIAYFGTQNSGPSFNSMLPEFLAASTVFTGELVLRASLINALSRHFGRRLGGAVLTIAISGIVYGLVLAPLNMTGANLLSVSLGLSIVYYAFRPPIMFTAVMLAYYLSPASSFVLGIVISSLFLVMSYLVRLVSASGGGGSQ